MHKIVVSAMKQSRKSHLPAVNPIRGFDEWMAAIPEDPRYLCRMEAPAAGLFLKRENRCIFAVGPEGDFTAAETTLAERYGFKPLSFGPMRLRTETAGVHVCSIVRFIHERVESVLPL